jgi:hypothetical protein
MPMTGAGLFAAVVAKLGSAQDPALQQAALEPICEAIVEYIQTNAIVAGTASAVQVGVGTAPVTGTVS